MRTPTSFTAVALACLLGSWGLPRAARAQSADAAGAEALFQEGRALLEQGRAREACPKLAGSYQLDPATGTLLALALCYEADGKLASAWAAFVQVEIRAEKANDPTRQALAKQKSGELHPRLSTLVIEVPESVAAVPGLELRRNGTELRSGTWNVALPLDGGPQLVEAMAPGKQAWAQHVELAAEGARETVVVPMLEDAPVVAPLPVAPAPKTEPMHEGPARTPEPSFFGEMNTLRWAGVGSAGAGLLCLGVGGYFLSQSVGQYEDSEQHCLGDGCTATGQTLREEAVGDGNLATGLGIGGAALIGVGVALFVVGAPSSPGSAEASAGPGVTLNLAARPTGAGGSLRVDF